MAVRIEKILCTVLNEAHDRQVEESMDDHKHPNIYDIMAQCSDRLVSEEGTEDLAYAKARVVGNDEENRRRVKGRS